MVSLVTIQHSLSSGELSPSLLGRSDLQKYSGGTSTCRNFFIDYRGGICSRPGFEYVGTSKQAGLSLPPRLIPFQFNIDQGYALEFGNEYMRIIADGAYVTESIVAVSTVSSAALFTTGSAHGYSVGDWVYDTGNTGFSGLTWIIATVPTTTTFTVTDLFGNIISSATASVGGNVARIYTVTSPYAAVDLPYLKYTQSADVMTLCCVNQETLTEYPPYSLTRSGATDWTFTVDTFAASISPPTNLTGTAYSSATYSTWYSYVVTAVNAATGEESNPSVAFNIQNNDISIYAGSNNLTWTAVAGAGSYNVYAATPSYGAQITAGLLFGYIGTALGTNFIDTNYTPDFTQVPPQHTNPFARGQITNVLPTAGGANYSQSTISYSVTTSTGSGFAGEPVVTNGQLSGFVISDSGQGYQSGDSISFSDSGGGLAAGNFSFSSNISANDNIEFNGFSIGFLAPNVIVNGFDQVNLGNTLALTLQNLANFLNASDSINLTVAQYTADATHVYVQYKTPGTAGNAYTLDAQTSGGTPSGSTLSGGGVDGSGATASLTIGPESGTYPAVPAYYSQRRIYASSLNDPDTYWMSQPGFFTNMDSSIPVTDADAITGTPWAQQVNGIQFLVPMPGGLVVLTGKGAWQVNGGNSAAITPADQDATPQAYNGCSPIVPPIPINYDILYVQAKGCIIRDLAYNFFVNIYTGTDLTVLSNHLFINNTISQWAWAEEPFKIVWVVRNDGILLSLTYLKEQDVYAWSRHDTNGLFVSVCSVTEPPVDAVYTVVQRNINGTWMYYIERMNNRLWENVEESFCVDAGLSYPINNPDATLYVSAATGNVTCTASSSVFSLGNVGDIIRSGGGYITITGYSSGTIVTGTVNSGIPITATMPNDPNNTPVPQEAGNWSLQVPVTTVSNLNHINGMTVAILADGSVVPNQIVTNNSITLPQPASIITVGLPYTCQAQTMYMDHPGEQTIQNKRKLISAVGVRAEQSRGLQIGANQPDSSTQQNYASPPWTNMIEIKDRTNNVYAGVATPLYTGDWYQAIEGGWTTKGQVAIQQVYPLPATILALILYASIGDDK